MQRLLLTSRSSFIAAFIALVLFPLFGDAQELELVTRDVEWQPLKAQVERLIAAQEFLGEPFPPKIEVQIRQALDQTDPPRAVRDIQRILDPLCLIEVHINPESRVKVKAGSANRSLVENGWRTFLVKVRNEAGVTAPLEAKSPNALPLANAPKKEVVDRWLDLRVFNQQPLTPTLSGLAIEYRLISLYSRDAGKRDATISFDVGQGTQDLGFRNEVSLLFDAVPALKVTFRVLDERGNPTTASFEIRDHLGRVYPSQAKRLAPDFAFHPQVYRADGETVELPAGSYRVRVQRGPESIARERALEVASGEDRQVEIFQVDRWIDPSQFGYWSGDHHIHAAGCAHYAQPTEGVHAPDMMRHCLGEDLKVGCNLTWGPCFDYQKQFFTGEIDKVSQFPYLLRYDVEVSGFGSHQSGHLCLLRLQEQMYPGGTSTAHWPTLCLNTLKWAKRQGAVVGTAHSGFGLQVPGAELPNLTVPPFDGIGANEYIVDVTHEVTGPDGTSVPAVDFLAMADTPYVWELNIWYHTLNCGFRTRISGETDFPCIYGERVGLGRSYVKLDGELDFDAWCEGIRKGRNYVGDGRSHLFDFSVNGLEVGTGESELEIAQPENVTVTARVAAWLDEKPNPELSERPYTERPYWHLERARLPGARTVPVELIVNGDVVARQEIAADGAIRDLQFNVPIEQSSWVALRVLPSCHTNPVFVVVQGTPIRASAASAEWCLNGVRQCRKQKFRFIRESERDDFNRAYDHAEQTYRQILEECRKPSE